MHLRTIQSLNLTKKELTEEIQYMHFYLCDTPMTYRVKSDHRWGRQAELNRCYNNAKV